MILTDDIKIKIIDEYNNWFESQYAGKSKEERQILGQFFTPPELSIKMIEKFEDLDGDILDPTCGAGGLIAACVIAGADPKKCYGIELDEKVVEVCRNRLAKLGVPENNIREGDALDDHSYDFDGMMTFEEKIDVKKSTGSSSKHSKSSKNPTLNKKSNYLKKGDGYECYWI